MNGAAEKKFYALLMHHIQLNISSSLVYVLQSLCQQAHNLSQFLSQLRNLLVMERTFVILQLIILAIVINHLNVIQLP